MLKTLIVEDNRLNRDTLKKLFSRHFSSLGIEDAADGRESMQKLESFQPDLILMDIRLPDVSGLELTKAIKVKTPHVKVVILTGHHYPEYEEAATRYGADGFLVKGGSSKEILELVETLVPKAKEVTSVEKK